MRIIFQKKEKNVCAILTLIMVLVALCFGLNPKVWSNDVQWLPDKSVIRFQNNGIAYVDNLRSILSNQQPCNFTIEMVVTAGSDQRRGFPLLVMHDGDDRRQLIIWQYDTSLIVMNGDDYNNSQRRPRVVAKNVFSSQQDRYFTIISGEQGTHLFVNGSLVATNSSWKLSIPGEGNQLRLILGNSVYGNRGWTGDLHGLVISGKALTPAAVGFRFNRWSADHNFYFMKQYSPLLLFTFNQKSGDRFSDQTKYKHILEIPSINISLKKKILSPPWKHLNWNRAAVFDMLFNTAGFIPLGAVLYGFLQSYSRLFNSHKKLITVTLCMILSLGIELGQAWIPARSSSLMDLILNTVGAWLGVGLWNLIRNSSMLMTES